MKNLFLFAILFLSFTTFGQVTSDEFRDAAEKATKRYNNVNKKCVPYTKKLYSFLENNASKYDIKSYTIYLYYTEVSNINIVHDDYLEGTVAISDNGKHYVIEIDGYVFDNHHPRGKSRYNWEKKLVCMNGTFPEGFDKDPKKLSEVK